MKNVIGKGIIAFSILFYQTQARDPDTIKNHSIERCGAKGVYGVDGEKPWWCCNCPAGYFKDADCGYASPTSTKCEMCPFDPNDSNNQTHTTGPNNLTACEQSINEAQCDSIRNAHWEAGSPTKPNSCVCDVGYFAKSDELMKYGCNQHSPCEEGFEPVEKGTGTANPRCRPCQPGMFSNVSSSTDMCKFHSKCEEGEIIESNGTSTSDTHCVSPREIHKVKDGTLQLRIVVPTVLVLILIGGVVIYYFWENGCPCRTTVEHVSSEGAALSSMNRKISEHVNKSFHESEASEDSSNPLIHNKDEANIDVERSSVEIIDETNQQTPLQTANPSALGTSRADEVVVKDGKNPKKVRTIFDDMLELCSTLDDDNKAKKLTTRTDWKETLKDLMEDPDIGKNIIYCWKNIKTNNLRPAVRMFLTEVEINDIEDSHKSDGPEIRHQWIYLICKNLGRTLTAEYLLSIDYRDKCFKDMLLLELGVKALNRLELKDPTCKTG